MKTKHQTIRLVKISLITLFICSTTFNSSAQELIFKDFKYLDGNTTARIYRHRDVNGQNCAVLIIKHNFKDFKVEAGKGYEYLEEKTGETWVWLSPDEYRIVIRKEGYIPFSYNLKGKLQSLETYELIISDEFGRLIVMAPTATIWLDNKIVGIDSCEMQIKEGEYKIKATKEKFYDEEVNVILNAGELKKITFDLKPKTGNLIINSNPPGSDIYVNNMLNIQKTPSNISLLIGKYNIQIEKDGFLPAKKDIEIIEDKNTIVDIELQKDPSIIALKHKRKSRIWLISSISFASVGTYSLVRSNMLYQDYQSAGENAADIRKQIETLDKVTPVAYSVAGLCCVGFIVQSSKHHKVKKKYNLSALPLKNGLLFNLAYNF